MDQQKPWARREAGDRKIRFDSGRVRGAEWLVGVGREYYGHAGRRSKLLAPKTKQNSTTALLHLVCSPHSSYAASGFERLETPFANLGSNAPT